MASLATSPSSQLLRSLIFPNLHSIPPAQVCNSPMNFLSGFIYQSLIALSCQVCYYLFLYFCVPFGASDIVCLCRISFYLFCTVYVTLLLCVCYFYFESINAFIYSCILLWGSLLSDGCHQWLGWAQCQSHPG